MKSSILLSSLFILLSNFALGQSELGAEYEHAFGKKYSSNSVGALFEGFSNTGKNSWQVGLHYRVDIFGNKTSHVSGSNSLGVSLGYRHGFSYGSSGNLLFGVRTSFTFITSSLIEFTPTAEFGYHFTYNHFGKGLYTTPSVALGYNLVLDKDEEEDYYKGMLLIPRVATGYRF